MKPVNRNLADEFHRADEDGIDAVFERMWQASGKWPGGYATAFNVSENTIKTWRRRGTVSTKFLQGFAQEHGTSLDYLLHGARENTEQDIAQDASERVLLERYRAAPKDLRDAALRVLLGSTASAAPVQNVGRGSGQQFNSSVEAVTQHGNVIKSERKGKSKKS